ncbi:TraB/GumN family protein [Citrobacter sp. JGM124]|uniref:TraB/GumN family protein n=1 Tax=Citrobacter sp. JGM124 TaxID=2799789 RepID=UPI001BAC8E2F|nr:TraB/GumN family protein [Citrobacter sp. JGM124]MBS0848957.1 TraB/GumN family protein [Citrobacter sp. JGM124]
MGLFQRLSSIFSRLTATAYPWPAIDISLPGRQHLHLVGSIHMGTQGMAPLPARLLKKLRTADALIIEADISSNSSPFSGLAPEDDLATRLSTERYQQVLALCTEFSIPLSMVDHAPQWQVALILQAHQAQKLGLRANYGIDYQLIEAARQYDIEIQELEGTKNQVELLTTLPNGGSTLLDDTLTHWHTNARMLQVMISWWLSTTPPHEETSLPDTFSGELHRVLIAQRNQQWCTFLQRLPPGHYVVAVGALHLFGEGNVPSLLKARQP